MTNKPTDSRAGAKLDIATKSVGGLGNSLLQGRPERDPPPIKVRGLRKVFRQSTTGQNVVAIDSLDLDIAPREVVAIVGQTGCGKSTFFDLMIGLERPSEGSIMIGNKAPAGDFDYFRGRIATVFQQDRLLPWRSALDNAKLPLELMGVAEEEQKRRALAWLERLGLGNFTNAYPHELSGGMRQRVAISRAFVVEPEILLAEVTAAELRATFLKLARECGSTAILITHQLEEAIEVGDRIIVFGKSAKLLADVHVTGWPKSEYGTLRAAIQQTLQGNERDGRLTATRYPSSSGTSEASLEG
jgi:NitT/TauT family transport system ATP-binding protein